jgi:hypothetical protein
MSSVGFIVNDMKKLCVGGAAAPSTGCDVDWKIDWY